jgi:hypothetical protein
MPSSFLFEIAFTGHEAAHAGCSQCMHGVVMKWSLLSPLGESHKTFNLYLPSDTPFSCLQAVSHDLHPMQRSVSTMIAYCGLIVFSFMPL